LELSCWARLATPSVVSAVMIAAILILVIDGLIPSG
jgi:hypothetical protein